MSYQTTISMIAEQNQRSEGEGDQKLTNQFSYVERATQTMNNTLKVLMLMLTMLTSVIMLMMMALMMKIML